MKISGNTGYEAGKYIEKTAGGHTIDDKQAAQKNNTASQTGDVVDLSQTSRDIQAVKKAVEATPDIRTDKVEEIKTRVQDNTYKVDYNKLADKIVGSILDELA